MKTRFAEKKEKCAAFAAILLAVLYLAAMPSLALGENPEDDPIKLDSWHGEKLPAGSYILTADAVFRQDFVVDGASESEYGPTTTKIKIDLNGHKVELQQHGIVVSGSQLTITNTGRYGGVFCEQDGDFSSDKAQYVFTVTGGKYKGVLNVDSIGLNTFQHDFPLLHESAGCEVTFDNIGFIDEREESMDNPLYNLISVEGNEEKTTKLTIKNMNFTVQKASLFKAQGKGAEVELSNCKVNNAVFDCEQGAQVTLNNSSIEVYNRMNDWGDKAYKWGNGNVTLNNSKIEIMNDNTYIDLEDGKLSINNGSVLTLKGNASLLCGLNSRVVLNTKSKMVIQARQSNLQVGSLVLYDGAEINDGSAMISATSIELNGGSKINMSWNARYLHAETITLNENSRLEIADLQSEIKDMELTEESRLVIDHSQVTVDSLKTSDCVQIEEKNEAELRARMFVMEDESAIIGNQTNALVYMEGGHHLKLTNSTITNDGGPAIEIVDYVDMPDGKQVILEDGSEIYGAPAFIVGRSAVNEIVFRQHSGENSRLISPDCLFEGTEENLAGLKIAIWKEPGDVQAFVIGPAQDEPDEWRICGSEAEVQANSVVYHLNDLQIQDNEHYLSATKAAYTTVKMVREANVWMETPRTFSVMEGWVVDGEKITIHCEPIELEKPNRVFKHWANGDGEILTTELVYEFAPKGQNTYTPYFEDVFYLSLTTNATAPDALVWITGESETTPKAASAEAGAERGKTLTAHVDLPAESACYFVGWQDANGTIISTDAEVSFEMTADKALVACFKRFLIMDVTTDGKDVGARVWISDDAGTTVEAPHMRRQAMPGQTLTAHVKSEPDSQWVFTGWVNEEGMIVSTEPNYPVEMTADQSLVACFEGARLMVTATASEGGKPRGGGEYTYLDMVTLTAIPDEGYDFVGWFDENGEERSTEAMYSFVLEKAESLVARFAKKRFKLTISVVVGEFDDISFIPETKETEFEYNEWIFLTCLGGKKDAPYFFQFWINDATGETTKYNPYTFQITENVSVTAVVKRKVQVRAFLSDEHAPFWINSVDSFYDPGETATVEITPKRDGSDYVFVGWERDGKIVSRDTKYTFPAETDVKLIARVENARVHHCVDYVCTCCGVDFKQEIAAYPTLILPKNIREVQKEALTGVAAMYVVVPEDIEAFDEDAVDQYGITIIYNQER